MKTRITTLCAFILLGVNSLFGQWVEQNPGANELFKKIDCVSGTNCFACAWNGTMMKTTDGSTWIDKSNGIPGTVDIIQLQMISEDTIYAYGDLNFYKSFDAGENWAEIPLLITLWPMHFINSNVGYANSGGDLYKTIDKGETWNLIETDVVQNAIFFVNESVGLVAKNTNGTTNKIQIWKTINGGEDFTMVYEADGGSTPIIEDIQMTNTQIGYACSANGKILKTTDGGDNWNELTHPLQGSGLFTSLDFINSTNGYVVGNMGAVLKTTDGGLNWTDESLITQYPQNEISVASIDTAYIAVNGLNLILKNSDANLTAKIFENQIEIGKIFPNPAQDILNVSIQKANTTLKVYDLVGNLIQEQDLYQEQNNIITLSEFKKGVYLYEISEKSVTLTTGKFIKN